jgi:hypothetical protein
MASSYVQTLRTKREEVLGEIRALRDQISEISTRVALKESQLKNLEDLLTLEGDVAQQDGRQEADAVAPSARFIEQAYRVLEQAGKPLHYRELAELLGRDGAYIPGQDPAANLLSHMSRDVRFGRTRSRGVYGLTEWPAVRAAAKPAAARSRRSTRRRTTKA